MLCDYPVHLSLSSRPLYLPLSLLLSTILHLLSSIHLVHPKGIHWQEPDVLVAVSDRMKSGGKQPFVCREHDQSIHTFLVPP